jgi:hypothetical protein
MATLHAHVRSGCMPPTAMCTWPVSQPAGARRTHSQVCATCCEEVLGARAPSNPPKTRCCCLYRGPHPPLHHPPLPGGCFLATTSLTTQQPPPPPPLPAPPPSPTGACNTGEAPPAAASDAGDGDEQCVMLMQDRHTPRFNHLQLPKGSHPAAATQARLSTPSHPLAVSDA